MRARLLFAFAFFAAVFLPANSSAAQDEASAKALLTTIFGHYGKGGKGVDYKSGYFHTSLVALVNADVKAAGTDVPSATDGDPVCDCQEWDGIWISKMDVKMETPQRAQAVVSFAIYAPKNRPKDDSRTIQLTLVPERGRWRIYDIVYLSEPHSDPDEPKSLRQQIQKDIDFYAHQPKP
ncbi:MAG: DUF3828 domain-containing protein [Terracidiphilus sp.]|jgi:hypothetical protein